MRRGGGPPKGAFLFHSSKAPPEDTQEGDPPIGKERGTLGVGTGPTSPPQDPIGLCEMKRGGWCVPHKMKSDKIIHSKKVWA